MANEESKGRVELTERRKVEDALIAELGWQREAVDCCVDGHILGTEPVIDRHKLFELLVQERLRHVPQQASAPAETILTALERRGVLFAMATYLPKMDVADIRQMLLADIAASVPKDAAPAPDDELKPLAPNLAFQEILSICNDTVGEDATREDYDEALMEIWPLASRGLQTLSAQPSQGERERQDSASPQPAPTEKWCGVKFMDGPVEKWCARKPGHKGGHMPYMDAPAPPAEPAAPKCPKCGSTNLEWNGGKAFCVNCCMDVQVTGLDRRSASAQQAAAVVARRQETSQCSRESSPMGAAWNGEIGPAPAAERSQTEGARESKISKIDWNGNVTVTSEALINEGSVAVSAERFLAIEGFADSRAHPATAIAALMERYAASRLRVLREAAQEVIDSAVTDADTCSICLADIHKHIDGCSIAALARALAKGE